MRNTGGNTVLNEKKSFQSTSISNNTHILHDMLARVIVAVGGDHFERFECLLRHVNAFDIGEIAQQCRNCRHHVLDVMRQRVEQIRYAASRLEAL